MILRRVEDLAQIQESLLTVSLLGAWLQFSVSGTVIFRPCFLQSPHLLTRNQHYLSLTFYGLSISLCFVSLCPLSFLAPRPCCVFPDPGHLTSGPLHHCLASTLGSLCCQSPVCISVLRILFVNNFSWLVMTGHKAVTFLLFTQQLI